MNTKQLALVPDLPSVAKTPAERQQRYRAAMTPEQRAENAARTRAWRATHPSTPEQRAKQAERSKKWEALHPKTSEQRARSAAQERTRSTVPEHRARRAAYREENRQKASERRLVRLYGLSREALDVLLQTQGGRCAICRNELRGYWHVDHDHVTERVRGLLCGGCNVGLGRFRDNPEALIAAAAYLRKGNV